MKRRRAARCLLPISTECGRLLEKAGVEFIEGGVRVKGGRRE
jgi:hypothetical protein